MTRRNIDITDQKYNRLTAIRVFDKVGTVNRWLCRCDCGKETVVRINSLRRGEIKSCGCAKFGTNLKHGKCGSKIYNNWLQMRARCYNPNNKYYKNYGGRNIKMCQRWFDSFEDFYADMGDAPANHSIDRINNDGDYEPSNCRWATKKEQTRNRRITTKITFQGTTKPLAEWSDELGMPYHMLFARIFISNWSVEKALTTPRPEQYAAFAGQQSLV
jgi:hypothetical protein